MGGYGALKWALRYPEHFAAAASLSEVTDIASRLENPAGDLGPFKLVFGDEEIRDTEDDLLWLLDQGNKSDKLKPMLYQCCGTEDFLYQENLNFKNACEKTTYPLTTDFSPGNHTWDYWDLKIQDVLKWFPLRVT